MDDTGTVDEFVRHRVLPEFGPVVAALRELMRAWVGKVSKHVKIRRVDEIDQEALRSYVEQALEFDTR